MDDGEQIEPVALEQADSTDRIRSIKRQYGTGAAMIAAAGLAIDELLNGKKDDRPVVVVNAQGEPPNVDELGLHVTTADGTEVSTPALPRHTPIIVPKRRRRGRR